MDLDPIAAALLIVVTLLGVALVVAMLWRAFDRL